MATTSKQVNYTEEQTATMCEQYLANPTKETVDSLAVAMGKTARSVIAKLSRSGVYKAKEAVTKSGEPAVKKEALADELGALIGATEGEIESLAKANKTVLNKLLDIMKGQRL